jgi:CubicO group peptidase (beta-lactamase class C family)
MSPTQLDVLDQIVETERVEGSIPAVTLAVVQHGRTIQTRGYGMANLEHMVPATEHTVFRIASITKTFTATAVMMLVERRKVGLDDPISRYLPDLPASWSAITLRHLLSHTSGIPSLNQMWGPARLRDGTATEYGLGWIVKEIQGRPTVGHWGRNPGFMAEMNRFVDEKLTVIVLCNRWKADVARLVGKVAGLHLAGL